MVEYRFFLMSSMIFSPSSDTKFRRYRMLNREKYADDFSVAMFKKHFRIIKIFRKKYEKNDKRTKSIVDELLAPTNRREYQNVLNKKDIRI